jgi:A/G-specific adenine glycosylase
MRWTPRLQLHEEALPGAMKKVLAHALGELPGAKVKTSGRKQATSV